MFNCETFCESLAGVGIRPRDDVFDELASSYGDASRHYHTQDHVADCLTKLRCWQSLARQPFEIEVAIWFHDAVYDSRRTDNEELSAEWADRFLTSENADRAVIDRIKSMILATKTHKARDGDTELMLDVDLSILGSPPAAFEAYDRAIRKEYAWVPEQTYRPARCRILKSFLDRTTIFRRVELRQAFENQARENLSRKIAEFERAT